MMNDSLPQDPDFCSLLGVPRDAKQAEIKRAYRRLARQYHPDVNPDEGAAAKFIALRTAYEALITAMQARSASNRQPDWPTHAQRGGYDVELETSVTADEAERGTVRSFHFHKPDGQPYTINVAIPSGVCTGMRVRVIGAGGPSVDRQQRGDLYVRVVVLD